MVGFLNSGSPIPVESPDVLLQQGIAAFRQGDMKQAEDIYTRVLLADPGQPHALHIVGLIAERRGDYEMAERLLWRSVQLAPHSRVYANLGVVYQHRGRLDDAIAAYRQAIALEPDYPEAWTNLIFALDMHPYAPWELLKQTREQFDWAVCRRFTPPPHQNDRDPDRKLRVGYLGGDFRMNHSAAMSFGWIADHDPDAVTVYLYSTLEGEAPTSAPFKERADVWCEVGHLEPHELAQVIYQDRIDILVDLAGASKGGRPLVVAMKPAPVQVTGWGYPSGLGIKAVDYLVGDDVTIPSGHENRYPERILRVPVSIGYRGATDSLPPLAETSPEERNGYRTYGYLGRAMKVTEPTVALWASLLRADPTSRLLLKSPQWADRSLRERVCNGLVALGVAPERIEVRDRQTSRPAHLAAHNEIDVALDPLVCGGGATIWDAAVMGVPTVTLPGEAVSGRQGASVMALLGQTAWITDSAQDYVEWASTSPPEDRAALRRAALASIGCDGPTCARAVEAAYRTIWMRYLEESRDPD